MPQADPWLEPSTLIAIGVLAIGLAGFLFGIFSYFWTRRETRLEALSSILQPMVRSAQQLHNANDLRRKWERLKASFPDPAGAQEAGQRVSMMIEEYEKLIVASEAQYRVAEAEYASRSFRLPDRIARLTKTTKDSLSEYGRLVNAGMHSNADLQFAKFRDDYKQVTSAGRGWRLADPLEGIRKRFARGKAPPPKESEFELSKEEMDTLMELVHKRVTSQAGNRFAVHPPRKLLDRPGIADAENVIEELKDSVFVVVFQDGTTNMLSLVELIILTYNLIVMAHQHVQASRIIEATNPSGRTTVQITFQFSIPELMRPEMVKALLEKIDFSDSPSDE